MFSDVDAAEEILLLQGRKGRDAVNGLFQIDSHDCAVDESDG